MARSGLPLADVRAPLPFCAYLGRFSYFSAAFPTKVQVTRIGVRPAERRKKTIVIDANLAVGANADAIESRGVSLHFRFDSRASRRGEIREKGRREGRKGWLFRVTSSRGRKNSYVPGLPRHNLFTRNKFPRRGEAGWLISNAGNNVFGAHTAFSIMLTK